MSLFLGRFKFLPHTSLRRSNLIQYPLGRNVSLVSKITPHRPIRGNQIYRSCTDQKFPEPVIDRKEELVCVKQGLETTDNSENIVFAFSYKIKSVHDLISLKNTIQQVSPLLEPKLHKTKTLKSKQKNTSFLYLKITEQKCVPKKEGTSDALTFLSWTGKDKEFFFLETGVVVGWNMVPETDQQSISLMFNYSLKNTVPQLKETKPFNPPPAETEMMRFMEGADQPRIVQDSDTIFLTKSNNWKEKLVFSIGLASSVKLDQLDKEIVDTFQHELTSPMATTKIEPRNQLSFLNCSSCDLAIYLEELKSPPVIGQSEPMLELYDNIYNYLEFESRGDFIKEKLDYHINYWTQEGENAAYRMNNILESRIANLIFVETILIL